MIKKIIPVILFFFVELLSFKGWAQTDSSQIIISYQVDHVIDTSHKISISYQLLLIANTKKSYCISRNKQVNDSLDKENPVQVNKIGGNAYSVSAPGLKLRKKITSFESTITYKNSLSSIITEKINIGGSDYFIKDSLAKMNWTIKKSFKEIAGYQCQLAVTNYKGRIWEAWFTREIPLSNGPWKLGGLPGLILEAKDQNNQIRFSFTGVLSKKMKIDNPKSNLVTISRKEYKRLLTAYAADPLGFVGNQSGLKINQSDLVGSNGERPKQLKYNVPDNPIESF